MTAYQEKKFLTTDMKISTNRAALVGLFIASTILGGSPLAIAQAPAPGTTLLQPSGVASASVAPKVAGRVSGTVVDAQNQSPVQYATVSLIDTRSGKPVDGAMTDEKGKFSLNRVTDGEYRLEVTFIGFETRSIPNITISDRKSVYDLGSIALNVNVQALKEVTVEGQRALFEEKVDRTVYNAEVDPANRSGDAAEVLRKVPMLSVDLEGNVTLRGSQNVRVLINNKPSTIVASSVADALKQIPADMIKSVEVITSPSARYDAEGSAGIINIVMKKETLSGFSLNGGVGAGLRGSDMRLNGNYRIGKMGFNFGGFGRMGYNIKGAFENNQTTIDQNGNAIQNTQEADTRNNRGFGRTQLGWDWDINKNNVIVASVRFGGMSGNTFQDRLLTQTFQNGNLLARNFRDVNITDRSGTLDVNVDFTHTFTLPQHEFNILTLYSRNNRTNNFTNNFLRESDFALINQFSILNESFNEEITAQLDYQNPISKNQMVEIGVKNISRTVLSDQASSRSQFNYNQSVQAGYLSYTLSFLTNYSLKAGARYENTIINADFQGEQAGLTIPSYAVFVPSLNLSKKLGNGNTLRGSYNRRIQRPSLQFLNPNLIATNPLSVTIGNPELDPELTDNFEISYNTFIKNTFLTFSTYLRTTDNAIEAVRDVIDQEVIRTTYRNIGKQDAYGVSVFGNVNISNKLTLNGGTDMYYAFLDNNISDPIYRASNEGFVYSMRAMGSYKLPSNWARQLFSFYRGRTVQLQGYQGGFGIYSLSLNRDFNNKKGSIGFGAENFFTPTIKVRSELTSPIISQNSTNIMYNTNFKVNLSYRIGKMTAENQSRRRRKTITNDDMKGGGGTDAQEGAGVQGATGAPAQGGAPAMMGGAPAGTNVAPAAGRPAMIPGQGAAGQGQRPGQGQEAKPEASSEPTDPNGTWTGTMGRFDLTLNLKAEGENLTGTVTTPRGETAITDGRINGNEISFSLSLGPNTMPYKGRIAGDRLYLSTNFMGQDVEGTLERRQ
ncbi:outer membrane beta-barrel family protein [soil metagenome]